MRGHVALFLATVLLLAGLPVRALAADPYYYVVRPDDVSDWDALVAHMGLEIGDPIREVLRWNPEVRNPYGLKVGQLLRIPGRLESPVYPAYTADFSRWKVVGTHTSSFRGSPWYREANIVAAANWIDNFFNDGRHPFITPRDALSLDWLLGETTPEKGYELGVAIGWDEAGNPVDVWAYGGGICQISSTIFPAVLKSGLNVLKRQNHSYYPYWVWQYPEGFGWDATIDSPNQPDLLFRNMYDYPVRLWLTADLTAKTLRVDVYGPPELRPYQVTLDGPWYTDVNPWVPAAESGHISTAARTLVTQTVDVGGSAWKKEFWSFYQAPPRGH